MAYAVPLIEPTDVRIGDSLTFDRFFSDYPPGDGWVATLYIRGLTTANVTASTYGTYHRFSVAAATTATWSLGHHANVIRVALAGEIHTVSQGEFDFLPDFSAIATVYDGRSYWRKLMDDVKEVMEGRAQGSHISYALGSRSGTFISPAELRSLYSWAETRYQNEQIANDLSKGKRNRNQLYARFISA